MCALLSQRCLVSSQYHPSCVGLFGTITTSYELSCSEKTRVNWDLDKESFESRSEGGDWRESMLLERLL